MRQIFEDEAKIRAILAKLSASQERTFNSQEFFQEIAMHEPDAYAALLTACADFDDPENRANFELGGRLRSVAPQLGYEQLEGKVSATTRRGTPTKATVYRRRL